MKNDQYIPHEVSMRSNSQVINLIEAEGAAGYGFYWALLEYLRAQNHYTGDIRAIKNSARQMKIRIDKAIRILNDYGLFVVENTLFSSQFLNERMVSFDRQRARCEAYKRKKDAELVSENVGNVSETPCNPLEIKDAFALDLNILVGAGVNADVIRTIRQKLPSIDTFHMSGKVNVPSGMIYRQEGVPMGLPGLDEWHIPTTSREAVAEARKALDF